MRDRLRDAEYVTRHRWLTLLVMCLSLMIIGLDNTVLNVALPTLARPERAGGLGASVSQLQWMVDAYTLVFAGLLLTAGSLGDRFGRYRMLTIGLVIFGVGSAMSAFASSPNMLIGTRALMGIGGACIMPATLSIITNVFTEPRERARAIGVWSGVAAMGVGIGPVIGGVLLQHFWWGSVFFINVPVVAAALVLGYMLVPESRDPAAPRLDPLGSVLSIAGLTALLWGIIEAPSHGWTSTGILAAFGIGALIIVAFLLWELHSSSPMLDVRIFENPRFSAASASITFTFLALFGMIFLLTQYLQLVLDYSTVKAGAVLVPMSAIVLLLAPRSPRLVARFGSKLVVAGGMFVAGTSLVLMTTFDVSSSTVHVIAVTLLIGLGMSHVMPPATESIMGSLPREKAGVGSAMNDTTRQVGGAIGVALLGSITASQFSSRMTAALGDVIPGRLLDAARDSVGAARGVARTASASTEIADAARASYVSAMHTALLVGAAIIMIGVVVVLIWLPAHAVDDEPHASIADVSPTGIAAVDVVPAGLMADVVADIEYEREHH